MYLVSDIDNPLTDSTRASQYQLSIQAGEMVEVIGPDGDTIVFIYGNGTVYDGNSHAINR